MVHSIYNVLNLRSSKCSDLYIDIIRHRRQFAIHGSVAACLNIVFKHGFYLHRTLRTSKLQTYRIYSRINIEIYDYPYNFSFRNCPLSSLFFSLFPTFFVCFIYAKQALDDESDTNADRAEDQCQLQTGHITHGYVQ